MDCLQTELLMSSLLNGDVDSVPADVEHHLEECESCGEKFGPLKYGHECIADATPFLAPDRHYLTPHRLDSLVNAASSQSAAERKIIDLRSSRKLRYYAVAATLVLIVGGVLLLRSTPEIEREGGGGDAVASTPPEIATFQLMSEFDKSVEAIADFGKGPHVEPLTSGETHQDLVTVSSRGITVPVRESDRVSQGDYWW